MTTQVEKLIADNHDLAHRIFKAEVALSIARSDTDQLRTENERLTEELAFVKQDIPDARLAHLVEELRQSRFEDLWQEAEAERAAARVEVDTLRAKIEAAHQRPWFIDLVNLTQNECYDKGRADVLAALAGAVPGSPPEPAERRCEHGFGGRHWVQNPIFGSCGEGSWCTEGERR